MSEDNFSDISGVKKNLLRRWGYLDVEKIVEQTITRELYQVINREYYLTYGEKWFILALLLTPSDKLLTSYRDIAAFFGMNYHQVRNVIRSLKDKGYLSVERDSTSRIRKIGINEEAIVNKHEEIIRQSAITNFLKHYIRDKNYFIQYLGGHCCFCGYKKNLAALEFHHVKREDKLYDISNLQEGTYNPVTVKAELDKCILVCSNCHREVESEAIPLTEVMQKWNECRKLSELQGGKNYHPNAEVPFTEAKTTTPPEEVPVTGAKTTTLSEENGISRGVFNHPRTIMPHFGPRPILNVVPIAPRIAPNREQIIPNEPLSIVEEAPKPAEKSEQYNSNISTSIITSNLKDSTYKPSIKNILPEANSAEPPKKDLDTKTKIGLVFKLSQAAQELLDASEKNKSVDVQVSPAPNTPYPIASSSSARSGVSGAVLKTREKIAELRNGFDKDGLSLVDEMLDALKLLRKSATMSINLERDWTELLSQGFHGELSFGTEVHKIARGAWEYAVKDYIRVIQTKGIGNENYFKKILISKAQEKWDGATGTRTAGSNSNAIQAANRNTHDRDWWRENYKVDDEEPIHDVEL